MIPAADVPAPGGPELRAAGLAALAEAGLVYLPAHLVLSDVAETEVGVLAGAFPFVAAYVAGVVLACRFRVSSATTAAAAVVAVVAGVWLGRADLAAVPIAVIVALLVALRGVTLAMRDWREPIFASIGVGAVVLGIETLLAGGALPAWRPPLLVFIPAFFVGALCSRMVTVWAPLEGSDPARMAWIRRAGLAMAGLGAAVATAAFLTVRGGVLERVGAWLSPAGNFLLSAFIAVVALAARPILWALRAVGVDPEAVRRALEEWRSRLDTDRAVEAATRPATTWWSRLFALLVLLGIAWLLYRALRRLRAGVGAYEQVDPRAARSRGVPLPEAEASATTPLPRRGGLPSETVRRWYADALLALHDRGLPKPPALTPAEYVPQVVEVFPDVADGFRRLTAMYEDARYGNRRFSGDAVHAVEPEILDVLAVLRRPA
ncbi:MAG TPA: DUF4129 domain-containing protein [Actinomycetota bacterium]|nr:DUF4129 domain-containing protein [Actinomycetota bacterium]